MNDLIVQLKNHLEFTRENTREKILVVDNLSQGRRLLHDLARSGMTLINVRVETIMTLADKVCALELSKEDAWTEITNVHAEYEILEILKEQQSGYYARPQSQVLAVAHELFTILQELAKAKSGPLFANDKQEATQAIFEQYKTKKQKMKWLDRGDILAMAIELLEKNVLWNNVQFFALSSFSMYPLEQEFLEKISGDNCTLLEVNKALDITKIEQNESVRFISCRGNESQLEFPFRDILEKGYQLEDCAIAYMHHSDLTDIYRFGSKWELPLSMEGGIELRQSRLYALLYKIKEFIEANYSFSVMKDILCSGICKIEKRFILLKTLEREGVAYGRNLYQLREDQKPKTNDEKDDIDKVFESWQTFLSLILDLENPEKTLGMRSEMLRDFIVKHGNFMAEGEGAAYKKVLQIIDDVNRILNSNESVLDCVLSIMESSTYNPVGSGGSGVLLLPINQATFIGRKYLYIVGLSMYSLENGGKESPLLLDNERKDIPGLRTVEMRAKENKDSFYTMLNYYTGNLVFLYSNFDSEKLIPQVSDAFYRDMLEYLQASEEEAGYISKTEMSYKDVMLNYIENKKNILEESKLQKNETEIPRTHAQVMEEFVFSPTSLETALECPFKFYLKYVLKIKETSKIEERDDRWLEKKIIGISVHSILEKYYSVQPANVIDLSLLEKFIEEDREALVSKYPCKPYKIDVQISELESINEMVRMVVRATKNSGNSIKDVEKAFGGQEELLLTFGKYKMKVQGFIDRVDELNNNQLEVMDYKSGDWKRFVNNGSKHLQFYLYAVVSEKLYPGYKVDSSSYFLLEGQKKSISKMTPLVRRLYFLKMIALLDIIYDEEKLQTFCPCYRLSKQKDRNMNKVSLVEAAYEDRIKARESCKKYCQYAPFCEAQAGE